MYTALHLNTNYNPHHSNSSDGNIILYKTAKFTIVIMFTAALLVKFLVVLDTYSPTNKSIFNATIFKINIQRLRCSTDCSKLVVIRVVMTIKILLTL